jgi:hypothetical protein
MSSIYPNYIDGYSQLPIIIDNLTPVEAKHINALRSAIINIETELGTLPKGEFSSLVERLEDIELDLFNLTDEISDINNLSVGVSDGDKGDITVSSSGTIWTVDDGAITFAKIQNITTDRLLGRDTALSGSTEELTVSGGIEFTGSGGIQRSALTGDVSASTGSNSVTVTQARGLRETTGPTTLSMGSVLDNQYLKRSGSTIIGVFLSLAITVGTENTMAFIGEGISPTQSTYMTAAGVPA